jgi:hypothetical protein
LVYYVSSVWAGAPTADDIVYRAITKGKGKEPVPTTKPHKEYTTNFNGVDRADRYYIANTVLTLIN